jgi:NADP-dependent 3-hydroxy acid dehydrogenase YdfG
LACADAGARVLAVSRTCSDLESLAAEAADKSGTVTPWVAHVTLSEFAHAIGTMEQLDVFVNNAGRNKLQLLAEIDDTTFHRKCPVGRVL